MTTAILHLGRTAAGPLLTLELAQAMIEIGEPIVVVYSSDAEIADQLSMLDCPTLAVSTFTNARTALTGLRRLPHLAKTIDQFLNEHRAVTVVVTMEQIWQALLARTFAKGRQVLLFVHDAKPHPGEDSRIDRALRARQRRHADGAVVLSQHVADELSSSGTFPAGRIWRTIHPAFHAPPAKARSLPSRAIVIGFFGRMSKYKGLGLGAQAIAELRRRGHQIEFRVVGRGIPLETPNISDEGNVLDDRWVSQNDVISTFSTFDLLLLPYIEASQSGVLAYAMALGVPSVVTPVGGLREQATETGAAIVSDSVTASSLADAVELLISSPEAYEQLSIQALKSTEENFSWSRAARDIARAKSELAMISERRVDS